MRAERNDPGRDPWLRSARSTLEVVTGGSYAAFLLAHAQLERSDSSASLAGYWAIAAAMILLPLSAPLAKRLAHLERGGERRWRWVIVALGALALLGLRDSTASHLVLAGLTFALGSLLVRYREERAAAWLLALAPAQVLCAMAAAPSDGWLLHLPLVVVAVCVGALVQSARHTVAQLRARASERLLRALEGRPAPRTLRLERLRSTLPIALVMLAATAAYYPLLAAIPRPRLRPESNRERAAREAQEEFEARRANEGDLAMEVGSRVFGEELTPGGALSEQSQEVVMTVRPRSNSDPRSRPVHLGPLYMRGACLDTFTATGMRSLPGPGPAEVRDEDDGRRDGWTMLENRGPREPLWLDVQQQSFRTRGGTWEVLFAPRPALAIQAPAVHHDPDGLLAFRGASEGGVLEYTVVAERRELSVQDLRGADAAHRDERFTQLPGPSEELAWIEREAAEQAAGAKDDLERVEALLDYFAREYEYSLRTRDVPGIAGIASFMRRGKGHCTSFAATSVLMLRTLGLSARVATGFLAGSWSEEEGMYLVSTRNGHAWIEVHFEGLGWCAFDPTPSREREAALSAAELGEDDGLEAWASDLRADLVAWARSGADQGELGLLLGTLADGPRAAGVSARRHPGRTSGLLAVLVTLVLWKRSRRRRRAARRRAGRSGEASREARLVDDLVAALRRLGVERGEGETLLELARRANTPDDELEFAVATLYRARFAGDEGLQAEERARIAAWIARTRARAV